MPVKKDIFENGLKIVTEKITTSNSLSIGFWVESGSANEKENEAGYAHFVEHMLFKGTKKRTAQQIAQEVDKVGAYLNATTTREYTGYFINIRKDRIDLALDILTDIIENSVFAEKQIKREKLVVLEEIKMYEDSPDEIVHDHLFRAMFGSHPLGRPILGTKKSIKKIKRENLINFYKRFYRPDKIIISAAGNVDHNYILEYLKKNRFLHSAEKVDFSDIQAQNKLQPQDYIIPRDLAQVHFCLGFPGLSANHPLRHSLYVLNTIFGSSMSSRLFQNLREKLGLCYSIYSFYSAFKSLGIFGIYAGTSLNTFEKAISQIIKEIKKIKKYGFTKNEIEDAKEHIKGHLALSYENNEVRMNRLAKQEMIFGRYFSYKEIVKMIDKVNADSIMEVVDKVFPDKYKIKVSSIGKEEHTEILKKVPLTI